MTPVMPPPGSSMALPQPHSVSGQQTPNRPPAWLSGTGSLLTPNTAQGMWESCTLPTPHVVSRPRLSLASQNSSSHVPVGPPCVGSTSASGTCSIGTGSMEVPAALKVPVKSVGPVRSTSVGPAGLTTGVGTSSLGGSALVVFGRSTPPQGRSPRPTPPLSPTGSLSPLSAQPCHVTVSQGSQPQPTRHLAAVPQVRSLFASGSTLLSTEGVSAATSRVATRAVSPLHSVPTTIQASLANSVSTTLQEDAAGFHAQSDGGLGSSSFTSSHRTDASRLAGNASLSLRSGDCSVVGFQGRFERLERRLEDLARNVVQNSRKQACRDITQTQEVCDGLVGRISAVESRVYDTSNHKLNGSVADLVGKESQEDAAWRHRRLEALERRCAEELPRLMEQHSVCHSVLENIRVRISSLEAGHAHQGARSQSDGAEEGLTTKLEASVRAIAEEATGNGEKHLVSLVQSVRSELGGRIDDVSKQCLAAVRILREQQLEQLQVLGLGSLDSIAKQLSAVQKEVASLRPVTKDLDLSNWKPGAKGGTGATDASAIAENGAERCSAMETEKLGLGGVRTTTSISSLPQDPAFAVADRAAPLPSTMQAPMACFGNSAVNDSYSEDMAAHSRPQAGRGAPEDQMTSASNSNDGGTGGYDAVNTSSPSRRWPENSGGRGRPGAGGIAIGGVPIAAGGDQFRRSTVDGSCQRLRAASPLPPTSRAGSPRTPGNASPGPLTCSPRSSGNGSGLLDELAHARTGTE
eukprot:TRINITY_DN31901_c0_g1_i3.p1 TRINITY_DN31901_c0_g1~~TRINITY_DN31901_c0_g1_i3.p1  ORF type:complete len:749 (-),score=121.74 TRINITY_DN31901_c0_g1_i3:161-2407(-)